MKIARLGIMAISVLLLPPIALAKRGAPTQIAPIVRLKMSEAI
jgi:hypothetical protein